MFRSDKISSSTNGNLRRRTLAGLGVTGLLLSLPGCATVSGSPNLAQVRIIDASPDAGGLDIYQGNGILAYNLGLGTITSYVPLTPGSYNIAVDNAGTRQQIVSAAGTFVTNAQYTVLIGNYSSTLSEVILKDQTTAAPTGQVSLRVLDQATRAGAVDLYLVASGSTITTAKPILTDVVFGPEHRLLQRSHRHLHAHRRAHRHRSGHLHRHQLHGLLGQLLGRLRKTIILIDQQLTTTPGLQVIIANDYESAGATS